MMLDSSREVLFVSAKRTAFGAFGGAFKDQRATDLGTHAAQAALAQAGFPVEDVDEVIAPQRTPLALWCNDVTGTQKRVENTFQNVRVLRDPLHSISKFILSRAL